MEKQTNATEKQTNATHDLGPNKSTIRATEKKSLGLAASTELVQ